MRARASKRVRSKAIHVCGVVEYIEEREKASNRVRDVSADAKVYCSRAAGRCNDVCGGESGKCKSVKGMVWVKGAIAMTDWGMAGEDV